MLGFLLIPTLISLEARGCDILGNPRFGDCGISKVKLGVFLSFSLVGVFV